MRSRLRWINACVITLLVLVCTWLLYTRGAEIFPGYSQPHRLPLLPFVLLALAVLLASGWHRTLIPPPGGTKLADGGRLLWTGAIVAFWVLSLPLWHQLGARVTGEGISYYVYLRSAVFDGDLDFTNEYEVFNLDDADPRLLSPTPTGVSRNVHAVGPAVVWSPFLAVGRVLQGLSSESSELTPFGTERPTREALDQETFGRGYAHVFVAAAPIGSIALLGLASVLWYREIARLLPPRDAAVGVVAAIVAGPLLWYTFFEPSMSHAPTAACLVFAMVAWRVWARDPSAGRALLVGLTAGLLAMQRWQFILWVVVPMGHLLYLAVRRDRPVPGVGESGAAGSGGSSAVKPPSPVCMTTPLTAGHLGLIMLGTLIALAPQFLAWKLVWGSWVVNPTGGGVDFIRLSWSEPKMLSVMWSQRHGLFTWHPVLLLAVIGFVPAWKRDRLLTGVCLGLFLAMVYVNAAVADWWGSDSFGQRRFAGLYPFFAWGLSAALASVRSARWRRAFVVVVVVCVLFNLGLAHGFRTGVVRRDWWVSVGDAVRCQVVAVQDATRWSLRRTAEGWPALAGLLYGVVDGHFMLDARGLVPTVNIGSDDRRYLGAGWGVSEHRPAGDFRWIIGTTGEVWLPLRHLRDHRLTLSGWPLGGDEVQRLRVSVNGELLAETVVMQGEGSWVFRVGEDVLRRGLNQVQLHLAWANPPSDADRRALSAAFDYVSIDVVDGS